MTVGLFAAHLDIGVHDPSMIWDGSHYYLFATGGTLDVRSATTIDTQQWTNEGNIFSGVPGWITTALGWDGTLIGSGIGPTLAEAMLRVHRKPPFPEPTGSAIRSRGETLR